MIIFTDNVSYKLLELLKLIEHPKRRHQYRSVRDEPFNAGMPDEEWIRKLQGIGEKESQPILAISADRNIRDSSAQRPILKQCNFNFLLATDSFNRLKFREQSWRYLRAWPALEKEIAKQKHPAVYEMRKSRTNAVFCGYIKDL